MSPDFLNPLKKAFSRYTESLQDIITDRDRDGAIQRFEYTFELSWKTLKRVLSNRGLEANSPKEVFRLSAQEGLIADPLKWFDFLTKRNLKTHVYEEDIAYDVASIFQAFKTEVEHLIDTLEKMQ